MEADLKDRAQRDQVLALAARADVLLEGFRPGVTERLGLGPEDCMALNPRLVYARMTGWGQSGPMASYAGHDINYISLTGVLHAIGTAQTPLPPLNLVGDYGGGSMFMITGALAALLARASTGRGDVVDAAMVDGVSVLWQPLLDLRANGEWTDRRSANLLDGAAPYYRTYATADGRHMAVGAVEQQFYDRFVGALDIEPADLPDRGDPENWPELTATFSSIFATRTRAEWCETFGGVDACVTPVLTFEEAPEHAHLEDRGTLARMEGHVVAQPAPVLGAHRARPADPSSRATVQDVLDEWAVT